MHSRFEMRGYGSRRRRGQIVLGRRLQQRSVAFSVLLSLDFRPIPSPINQALGCVVACLVLFFRTRSCASLLGKSMSGVVLVLAVALAVAGVVSTETLFVKSSQLSWSSQSIVRAERQARFQSVIASVC